MTQTAMEMVTKIKSVKLSSSRNSANDKKQKKKNTEYTFPPLFSKLHKAPKSGALTALTLYLVFVEF